MKKIALLIVLATATPLSADPCATDIEFICKGKAGSDLEACLDGAANQVSAECRTHRQAKKQAVMTEAMAACAEDAEKHCVARLENETVYQCLLRSKVSDGCADKLPGYLKIKPGVVDSPYAR